MDHLDRLESESIFVLRESYFKFKKLAFCWSIGKDSTTLLWLIRKAFSGHCPLPAVHIDTTFKIPEMIRYRDHWAKVWGLNLIIGTNTEALKQGMNATQGRIECCTSLKTDGLKQVVNQCGFEALLLAIRRDEDPTRAKERIFSPRGSNFDWNIKDQPPELWNLYPTEIPEGSHLRIHPLLNWTEVDVWKYIQREKIPVIDLYFAKNGRRYRSIGCAPCSATVPSEAATVEDILRELDETRTSERAGRAQDVAADYAMQKLRIKGYM